MKYREDLSGKTYGRLTVLSFNEDRSIKRTYWSCECSCGSSLVVAGTKLKNSHTRSCGCLAKELLTTHGMSRTPTYTSYRKMLERCTDKAHPAYGKYGGSGITVCDRWLNSPLNFLTDMGERPDGMTLDRIDGSGGYDEKNCRWATPTEQSRNRKSNKLNPTKVYSLRAFNRWGLSNRLIGHILGCHRRAVEDVLDNKTWKGVAQQYTNSLIGA